MLVDLVEASWEKLFDFVILSEFQLLTIKEMFKNMLLNMKKRFQLKTYN